MDDLTRQVLKENKLNIEFKPIKKMTYRFITENTQLSWADILWGYENNFLDGVDIIQFGIEAFSNDVKNIILRPLHNNILQSFSIV